MSKVLRKAGLCAGALLMLSSVATATPSAASRHMHHSRPIDKAVERTGQLTVISYAPFKRGSKRLFKQNVKIARQMHIPYAVRTDGHYHNARQAAKGAQFIYHTAPDAKVYINNIDGTQSGRVFHAAESWAEAIHDQHGKIAILQASPKLSTKELSSLLKLPHYSAVMPTDKSSQYATQDSRHAQQYAKSAQHKHGISKQAAQNQSKIYSAQVSKDLRQEMQDRRKLNSMLKQLAKPHQTAKHKRVIRRRIVKVGSIHYSNMPKKTVRHYRRLAKKAKLPTRILMHFHYTSQFWPSKAADACEAASLKMGLSALHLKTPSLRQMVKRIPRSSNPERGYTHNPFKLGTGATIYPHLVGRIAAHYGAKRSHSITGANASKIIYYLRRGDPVVCEGSYRMHQTSSDHILCLLGYKPGRDGGSFYYADPFSKTRGNKLTGWVNVRQAMSIFHNHVRGDRLAVIEK